MAGKKFPLEIIIGAIDKFSTTFSQFGNKIDRLGKKASQLGKNLSVRVTAPLTLLGGLALKSAANLEQLEIRFSSLVGSMENAKALMERLKTFAAVTPFELNDVADAAAGLLAAGFAAETLEDNLKILGDIAAGSGGSLGDMVPLFTEIRIKGAAFTQDLRQFATRGIPIIKVLAEQLGVTEAKIFDMASKGKISFKLIERALRSMTEEGGLFANQMEKQSQSLFGLFSTLKDTGEFALAELGMAMADAVDLSENITKLTDWIQELTRAFKELDPTTQKFIVWGGLAAAALGPLLVLLGALAWALTALASTAGLVIAGFIFFVGIAILIGKKLADIVHTAGGVINVFKIMGAMIVDKLISPFTALLKLITAVWDFFGTPPAFLENMANFSLAKNTARGILEDRKEKESSVLGGAAAMKDTYALQQRALAGDKTAIEVLFKNQPAGMRASVVEGQKSNVTIDQGVSMAGGY